MGRRQNRTLALIEESIAIAGGIRRRAEYAASWLLDDPRRAMEELEQIHEYASDWEREYKNIKNAWDENGQPDIFNAGWTQGQIF